MKIKRRTFLSGSLAIAASSIAAKTFRAHAATNPFQHNVASGDPTQNSLILWTKLTTPSRNPQPVSWIIAKDQNLRQIIRRGQTTATPRNNFTVKIDAQNLPSGQTLYYAFQNQNQQSPLGRTQTLPSGTPDKIKIAVVSCSNYNAGYFNVYRALAERSDLNAVLHLGDYIYEYPTGGFSNHPDRTLQPQHEILSLSDYRTRYAHYRSDPDLQALHAAHPVIPIWDDHEIANDSWKSGAQNHSANEGNFADRQKAAKRAYDEWMPIRWDGENLYRRFAFGDMAALIMLDTRHDERDQPISFRQFFLPPAAKGQPPGFNARGFLKALNDPNRRIMSDAQESYIAQTLSRAAAYRWTLFGNQVPFTPTRPPDLSGMTLPDPLKPLAQIGALAAQIGKDAIPFSTDNWSGYPAARARLQNALKRANQKAIILTGDSHTSWARPLPQSLGVEFGAPSVTSSSIDFFDPALAPPFAKRLLAANPNFAFADLTRRGYMILELTREEASASWFYMPTQRRGQQITQGPRLRVTRDAPHIMKKF